MLASGVRLATFPVGDVAFATYVHKCWNELDAKRREEPEELQHLVRRWHTRALVVPQSPLAALRQGRLWYVFRDGRGGGPSETEWWTAPGTACVTFDADLWTIRKLNRRDFGLDPLPRGRKVVAA